MKIKEKQRKNYYMEGSKHLQSFLNPSEDRDPPDLRLGL